MARRRRKLRCIGYSGATAGGDAAMLTCANCYTLTGLQYFEAEWPWDYRLRGRYLPWDMSAIISVWSKVGELQEVR